MRNRRDRPSTAVAVAVVLGFALLAAATGPAIAVSSAAGQGAESGDATDRRLAAGRPAVAATNGSTIR